MPTLLAASGDSNIKEQLLNGVNANGRDYKVHLDGYNMLPYLTGEVDKDPRNEIFYFSDDGDLTALRYDAWKLIFMEQKATGTFRVWMEPFVPLRVPLIENLRRDPYERPRSLPTPTTTGCWIAPACWCRRRHTWRIPGDFQGIPAAHEGRQLQPRPGDGEDAVGGAH